MNFLISSDAGRKGGTVVFCQQCGVRLPDDAAFCPNCGTKVPSAQKATDTYTPPMQAQSPAQWVAVPQRGVDIKKLLEDLITSAVGIFIVCGILLFVEKVIFGIGELRWVLVFYWTIFGMIPEVTVVALRLIDPRDAAYKIGRTQDEEIERNFQKKYERLKSVMGWIIFIMVIVYNLYVVWHNLKITNPAEMRELERMLSDIIQSV